MMSLLCCLTNPPCSLLFILIRMLHFKYIRPKLILRTRVSLFCCLMKPLGKSLLVILLNDLSLFHTSYLKYFVLQHVPVLLPYDTIRQLASHLVQCLCLQNTSKLNNIANYTACPCSAVLRSKEAASVNSSFPCRVCLLVGQISSAFCARASGAKVSDRDTTRKKATAKDASIGESI